MHMHTHIYTDKPGTGRSPHGHKFTSGRRVEEAPVPLRMAATGTFLGGMVSQIHAEDLQEVVGEGLGLGWE